jgi:F-type H+-transporting ATPase subunit delta
VLSAQFRHGKDNNILRVKLISADEIKSKRLKEFKETLENKYPNMKIEIINEINPNLIGGVQIITDDASIDASIRGTLDKIRGSL